MASARGSPIRPVVSRVKLPQPGRGQMRVSDITAGSGCADPQSRSGSARSAARSVPTPVLDASPGPVVTRHVRTPELRHGTTLESIHSVHSMHSMHSMHRSNSEMLVRSLQRTESSQGREEPVASDPGSARSADLHSTSFEASLPAASVWMPDANLPDLDLGDLATKPPALPRSSTTEALPRAPPSRQATRTNSRSLRGGSKERPQSEPPHQAKYPNSGGRLPELLDEIEDHLLQQTVRPPADASGWLKETAQLEIYAEEMRKLLQTFKAPEAAPPPRRAGRRNDRGVHAKPLRELSVLRGDKELRWARQQLKNCEREYLHLQQLLGSSEKQLVAELRQVKDSLEQEKRKVKHLEHESHKRERSMARVAARAGGGELSVLTVDGNTLAMREVERLEAELEVYQMKNSSLMKQVEGESHRLDQAMQSRESQNAKYEALLARLQSEDTKKRLAEEQKQQDSQQREEDQLRAEIRQLQEARRISARTTERTLKERQKRLEELRQKQTEHEGHLMQLKSSVPRAPKASRRRDSREAREAREVEVTKVSGDIDVAGQSPEAAELNPSGVTQVDVDAEIRLEAENGPPSGDGCHDLEESPLEDVNADSP